MEAKASHLLLHLIFKIRLRSKSIYSHCTAEEREAEMKTFTPVSRCGPDRALNHCGVVPSPLFFN